MICDNLIDQISGSLGFRVLGRENPMTSKRIASLGRVLLRPLTGALVAALWVAWAGSAPAAAQNPTISVEALPCLPQGGHGVARARVENEVPGTEVQLHFRRLNPLVEDFYWIEMESAGGGRYWVTVPAPDDDEFVRHDLARPRDNRQRDYLWAAWWREKDLSNDRNPNGDLDDEVIRERASQGKTVERDWLRDMELADLQQWLREQRYEPAEYFAAVVAPDGRILARSPLEVVPVTDDCDVQLDPREEGMAGNLVIGETAPWQESEGEVFHWLCDGIVSRVDPAGILRIDRHCRTCVIAWWEKKSFLIPASIAGIGGIGGVVLDDPSPFTPEPEPEPSPSEP